ncbi:MAG: DUF421 domain-containing protein [Armatimonadota bacterium]|nr:DUF421 domain-containing protein [Armatimonadota bacterium]
MFFSSWQSLERVLIVGILAYVGLILLLRLFGKRTLSKMNAFDLIVTIALGSILATVLLSKDVALAEGLLAFGMLIGLQFIITWLSVRWPAFSKLVKADPALLYHQGQFLAGAMRRERVVEAEIRAAVRAQGIPTMSQVGAVVLETDGSFTVLHRVDSGQADALNGVTGAAGETDERGVGC